jgi:hypothetical protein
MNALLLKIILVMVKMNLKLPVKNGVLTTMKLMSTVIQIVMLVPKDLIVVLNTVLMTVKTVSVVSVLNLKMKPKI